MDERIYTVSAITKEIKLILRNALPSGISVTGEISNYKLHSSGHLYFSLKDDKSVLKAVMFNAASRGLSIRDGDKVVCKGYIGVYEPYGTYQLIADSIEKSGEGELYREYIKIKNKLEKEGLFDISRKQKLPAYPLSIGIVTSPTGAVIRDISNVLLRRAPYIKKYIYPAAVQGKNAHESLIQGITFFNNEIKPDIIIIGRGGGSIEDLWAFNNEELARAVFNSRIPVISAVGHETDFTIIDFAADRRAPTPSAAAEIAVRDKTDIDNSLHQHNESMKKALNSKLQSRKQTLHILSRNFYISSTRTIDSRKQHLEDLRMMLGEQLRNAVFERKERIAHAKEHLARMSPVVHIAKMRMTTQHLKMNMQNAMNHYMKKRIVAIEHLKGNLRHLSPLNTLNKGYSIVYNNENVIIKNYNDADAGDEIRIRLAKGSLRASVKSKEQNDVNKTGKEN